MVEVWLVELEQAATALEAEERRCSHLSADDLGHIAGLNHPQLRRQRRLSTIALRVLIAAFTGSNQFASVPIVRLPGGKPVLPGAPFSFSLSHAAGRALIALSPGDFVGVDIERQRALRMSAPRQAALIEAANALPLVPDASVIEKLPPDRVGATLAGDRVLRAWVRLEALAKLDGSGMARLLTAAGVLGRRFEAVDGAGDGRADAGAQTRRSTPDWPGSFMQAGFAIQDLALPDDPSGSAWYAALAAPVGHLRSHAVHVRRFPADPLELMRPTPGIANG